MLNSVCSFGPYVFRDKNSKNLKKSSLNPPPSHSRINLCSNTCVFSIVLHGAHFRTCLANVSNTNARSLELPPPAPPHVRTSASTCFSFGGTSSKFVALLNANCVSANSFSTAVAASFACVASASRQSLARLPESPARVSLRVSARARRASPRVARSRAILVAPIRTRANPPLDRTLPRSHSAVFAFPRLSVRVPTPRATWTSSATARTTRDAFFCNRSGIARRRDRARLCRRGRDRAPANPRARRRSNLAMR